MSQEDKMDIKVALMTVIALTALLGGIGFIVNVLLDPVKESQVRMEKRMDTIESKMDLLLAQKK